MKYITWLPMMLLGYSCHIFSKHEVPMGKFTLKNGTVIEVIYVGYGATSPNVVWITKVKNNQKVAIGKIEGGDFTEKVSIYQIDDARIKVRLTTTEGLKGLNKDYSIDLNHEIDRNNGSPF